MIKNRITIITLIILVLLSLTLAKKVAKKKLKERSNSRNNITEASNSTLESHSKHRAHADPAGTNVFQGKNNASNAVGLVGGSEHTITQPPYEVVSCDQVLQIPGTFLHSEDYDVSKRKPGFMTLSIYFANFFNSNNSSQLLKSLETQMLTSELVKIDGAPGCTTFKTINKKKDFCFKDETIREQIRAAAKKFLSCKPDLNNDSHLEEALKGCDLSKVDLSHKGPFGKFGKKIAEILRKIKGKEQKFDFSKLKGVNPYYLRKGIPGDPSSPVFPPFEGLKK